jgi:gliding motility-associated-like protein
MKLLPQPKMTRPMQRLIITIALFFTFVIAKSQQPDPPEVLRVSVDINSGNVVINWNKSKDPSVKYYIIYTERDPNNHLMGGTKIDSVPGAQTQYIDNSQIALSTYVHYYIVAKNSNVIPYSVGSTVHGTMLITLKYDTCKSSIHLSWSHYLGWGAKLDHYNIYCKMGNQPFAVIGSTDTSTLSFTHQNIEENQTYCYYIEAINKDGLTSTSNQMCETTTMSLPPSFINADYATVEGQNLSFSFTIDSTKNALSNYRLEHSNNASSGFTTVANFINFKQSNISYKDTTLYNCPSDFYRLSAINSCDNAATTSNVARPICLNGMLIDNNNITLYWTAYENWLGGVESYTLYRDGVPLQTLTPTDTSFTDDISKIYNTNTTGQVCYLIEAKEGNSNPHGIMGHSRSNDFCMPLVPGVYMPNALAPKSSGINNEFKPTLLFIPKEYKLFIYDRWGKLQFQTTEPGKGWKGELNNNETAPLGVYMYYLYIKTPQGQSIEKKGSVTVVYP